MLLDIVVLLGRLPRLHSRVSIVPIGSDRNTSTNLIESLKDESVDTPTEHTANSIVPVGLGVILIGDGVLEVLAASRPVGLADPEGNVDGALDVLNMLQRLHDVVEEHLGGVGDLAALPVGKGIGEAGGILC